MKKLLPAGTLFAILALTAGWAHPMPAPASFRVIVHSEVPVESLTRSELSEIFLKSRVTWPDGTPIRPIDHPIRSSLRARFLQAVYGKSPRFMTRYWHRRIFAGRDLPPPEAISDADVVAFVRQNRGAIGYVSAAGSIPDGVKIVELRF